LKLVVISSLLFSGNFQGDIAIPDSDFFKPVSKPPPTTKLNKSLQEEVERLKKEVLLEGLQVEEEGLTDILRKRTKQPVPLSQEKPKKYNDATLSAKVTFEIITISNNFSNCSSITFETVAK
jgi:hypothetical protein